MMKSRSKNLTILKEKRRS